MMRSAADLVKRGGGRRRASLAPPNHIVDGGGGGGIGYPGIIIIKNVVLNGEIYA